MGLVSLLENGGFGLLYCAIGHFNLLSSLGNTWFSHALLYRFFLQVILSVVIHWEYCRLSVSV